MKSTSERDDMQDELTDRETDVRANGRARGEKLEQLHDGGHPSESRQICRVQPLSLHNFYSIPGKCLSLKMKVKVMEHD